MNFVSIAYILVFLTYTRILCQELQFLFETDYIQTGSYYSDQTQQSYWLDQTIDGQGQQIDDVVQTQACINLNQLNMNVLELKPNHFLKKIINQIPPHFQLILTVGLVSVDIDFQQFYATIQAETFIQNSTFLGTVPSNLQPICLNPADPDCQQPIYINQSDINGLNYCGQSKKDVFFNMQLQLKHNLPSVEVIISSNMFDLNQQLAIKSIQLQYFPCRQGCQRCVDSSLNCTQCLDGLYLMSSNLDCVQNCPIYFYLDQTTNTCFPCSQNCRQCQDSTTCLECSTSYFIDENNSCSKCDSNCQTCKTNSTFCTSCQNQYYLTPQNTCEQCDPSCRSCKDTSTYCTSCINQHYLTSTNTCDQCSPQCNSCQDSADNCLSCSKNYNGIHFSLIQFVDSQQFVCQQQCNDGYFASLYSRVCILCSNSLCDNCIPDSELVNNKSGCINSTCQPGLFKYQNECRPDCYGQNYYVAVQDPILGGVCEYCDLSVCSQCISSKICKQCQNRYYLNSNQWCSKCDANCSQCTGPGNCIKCLNGFLMQDGVCVASCSSGYYVNGYNCLACHQGCANCTGPQSNQCTKCSTNYQLFTSECLIRCQSGYFRDIDRICKKCTLGCDYCTNALYCNTCLNGFYLNQGTQQCSYCNPQCSKCNGPSQSDCTGCQAGLILFKNQCIKNCPNGYYLDPLNNICLQCTDPNCKICNQPNQCSQCLDNSAFLVDFQSCSNSCPSSHQSWSNNIIDSYNKQIQQNYCYLINCQKGYKQQRDQCVEICGDGLIFDLPCDDGNNLDGDGCNSNCQIEKYFTCAYSTKEIKSICTLNFSYSLQPFSQNQVRIVQNVQVKNYQNAYQVQVIGFKSSQYMYSISPSTNDSNLLIVSINFLIQVSSTQQVIIHCLSSNNLEFANHPQNMPYTIVSQPSQTIQLETSYVPSQKTQQVTQGISQTSKVVSKSIVITLIPMTQLFLETFKEFEFSLLNPFTHIFNGEEEQSSYESFTENDMKATFLINSGYEIVIVIITVLTHQLLKFIFRKSEKYSHKIKHFFVFKFYTEIIMSIYTSVTMSIFLQFTNMEIRTAPYIFNYIVTVICLLILIPLPLACFLYMRKIFPKMKEEYYHSTLGFFYEDMKEGTYFSMSYNCFLLFRKLLFALLIVCFNFNSVLQCALLCAPSLMLIVFMAFNRPFKHKIDNFTDIAQELFLISAEISIAHLKSYDDSLEEERELQSIPILTFFLLIFFVNFLSTILEIGRVIKSYHLILKIKQIFAKLKLKLNKKKVHPISSQDSIKMQSSDQKNNANNIEKLQQNPSIVGFDDNYNNKNENQKNVRTQLRQQSTGMRLRRVSNFQSPQLFNSGQELTMNTIHQDQNILESRERMFDKDRYNSNFKSTESIFTSQNQQQLRLSSNREIQVNNQNNINEFNHDNLEQLVTLNYYKSRSQNTINERSKSQLTIHNNEESIKETPDQKFVKTPTNQDVLNPKLEKRNCSIILDLENEDDFNKSKNNEKKEKNNHKNSSSSNSISSSSSDSSDESYDNDQTEKKNKGRVTLKLGSRNSMVEIIPISSRQFINNPNVQNFINSLLFSPGQSMNLDIMNGENTNRSLQVNENQENQNEQNNQFVRNKRNHLTYLNNRRASKFYIQQKDDYMKRRKSQLFDPSNMHWK